MNAVSTICNGTKIRHKYGSLICLEDVDQDDRSDELFREVLPRTQYRVQIFHRAATLGVNKVFFFGGTDGLITECRILYGCVIRFAEQFLHKNKYAMDYVHLVAFERFGGQAKFITK